MTKSVGTGEGKPAEQRALWIARAACFAMCRNEPQRCVDLLLEAYELLPHGDPLLDFETARIRTEADGEMHRLLDEAGIPRPGEE